MKETKYFIFPVGKPEEKLEVLPHTAGNGIFKFADASLAGGDGSAFVNAETLYTFTNGVEDADQDGYTDKPGDFVNNDVEQLDITGTYDIVKEEVTTSEE